MKAEPVLRPKKLSAYLPFVFSPVIDPRNILTVGDQVIAEHVFAFHARSTPEQQFSNHFSEIQIFADQKMVRVKPRFEIKTAAGEALSLSDLCETLRLSLAGTRHAPYGSLLKSIQSHPETNSVEIHFEQIPVNLQFLFTLPDFCFAKESGLPVDGSQNRELTGPYFVQELSGEQVVLRRNPHYPPDLVSNKIECAKLNRYNPSETKAFIENLDPDQHQTAYFFGHALSRDSLVQIKDKGFKTRVSASEWFIYIRANNSVDLELKAALEMCVSKFRESKLFDRTLGQAAYSISPKGCDFALDKGASQSSALPKSVFERKLQISTLTTWAKMEFFEKLLTSLKSDFPKLEIQLVEPKDLSELYSEKHPLVLSPLGISPTDPLSHFSFLAETVTDFTDVISKDEIAAAAKIANVREFNQQMRQFETRLRQKRLIIPIAHFPGVTAYRNDFSIDDSISFSWGIQLWSLRVDD